ncbi:MAG: VWA domain-containing protein [Xanthomonadales bacterium]|nr:VWA domain-containing protein [Xanthomonadales bacterium]
MSRIARFAFVSLSLAAILVAACSQSPHQADDPHAGPALTESAEQAPGKPLPAPAPEPPPLHAPSPATEAYAYSRQASPSMAMDVGGSQPWSPPPAADRENYAPIDANPVHRVSEQPVSTFSVDVDTASYANVRRMLNQGRLPPSDAVRAEEFINYFDYGYAPPSQGTTPFATHIEIAPSPWQAGRHLLLIGIQGWQVPVEQIPAANLVFLVDTSGSMNSPDKLELLKKSLGLLTRQLRPQDRVAIVAYAGSAGIVLPSTPGSDQAAIVSALAQLRAAGATAGGAGLELAYTVARQHHVEGGVSRVILASDGDFNVGRVSIDDLTTQIGHQRDSGIGLTVLGFGGGNFNDHLAEQLAAAGNGNYHYIDTLNEGRKVLVEQLSATVLTIAQDVKIQIEFNPAAVQEYRLIGYENRLLAREDFNNDQVDAGDIGAGHNVTALYEITLAGSDATTIDPLRYGQPDAGTARTDARADELAFLRLRYKRPGESASQLIERPVRQGDVSVQASERLRFAAAVAGFADALRGGRHLGSYDLADLGHLAAGARGDDRYGYRGEFLQLLELARVLKGEDSRSSGAGAD